MNELNIVQLRKERLPGELAAEAYSIIGDRKTQQDFAGTFAGPDRVLAVLCDGMGGLMGGERASREAAGMLLKDYETKQPSKNFADFLCREAVRMDARVHGLKSRDGRRLDAGTTVVAAVVSKDGMAEWMSVGDSRIYIIRGHQMQQVTRDHNYWLILQEQVAAGQITMEEAVANRKKEALISYLGMGNVSLMDINPTPVELQYGDMVMLCSDGITKTLPDAQIQKIILADAVRPEQKAEALVDAATHINSHSQDNTSVVLIHYEEIDIKKSHH